MMTTPSHRQALEVLTRAGLRLTRQRIGLARLLFDSGDRHVTAELLHDEAMAADMRISLATVYNTLHQMTAAGLLREVVVKAGRSYFDTNTTLHHHFFHERTDWLGDVPGNSLVIENLPEPPCGTVASAVHVIIHLRDRPDSSASN
ncbi:MAG: iron response transcriptional regulator IrrA [Rhodospirillaceae bacterium]